MCLLVPEVKAVSCVLVWLYQVLVSSVKITVLTACLPMPRRHFSWCRNAAPEALRKAYSPPFLTALFALFFPIL